MMPVSIKQKSLLTILTVFFSILMFLSGVKAASTISGTVYDDQRNPVVDVDIELLNENYALRGKTRTDGVGRYEFNNLADGRYYIKALPFRYNLRDRTEEVIVETLSILGTGTSFIVKDIYLTRKTKKSGKKPVTASVFAQDVPPEAETLYKEGVEAFAGKESKKGFARMIEAIELFPDYFAALHDLGLEFMRVGENLEASKVFIRAVEVNPKSHSSFYYLGIALHGIGKEYNKAALVALNKAKGIAPGSYQILLQIGKIERIEGMFDDAEKSLLKAKELAKEPVPEIHIELAHLYGNDLKDFGKAADELESYMKASGKTDARTRQRIADLRAKAKQNS